MMQDDPRKAIVEVMARLGRETQLHMDERVEHFKITDSVIRRVSILLLVIAIVNVYLVWVLSRNMDGIVQNIDSMQERLVQVDRDMTEIAKTVEKFDSHITYMHIITSNIGSMTTNMPAIRKHTDGMTYSLQNINQDMNEMSHSIYGINLNMYNMSGGISGMEYNVRQFSKPMGVLNPLLP